jgi:uncharacterized membrane protein
VITARRLSAFVEVLAAVALLLLLSRPLIFDGSDRGVDFYTHYWFSWHQSEALRHGGPSLYVHDFSAVYITQFAFYGATLYVLTGALGILLGSILHAYVLTFVLAFAASYGGWWWLGRQAGLGRLVAHVPGIVFVTSAYAMSLLYLRGDWAEHVAVGVIPLLVASGISVLRADRLRPGPALALLISSIVFFGSHNLTLLCGTTLIVVLAVPLLATVPQARSLVTRRGLLRIAMLVVPALMVSAWFLVPDIVYRNETGLGTSHEQARQFLTTYRSYVTTEHLFTLGRGTADPAVPHFSFALPVLAMVWTVIVAAVSRPRLRDPWLRVLLILAAVTTLLIVAMTHVGLLRGPFALIQFSYRLESYINMTICGAVLATLVLLRDAPRTVALTARWALAPIAAVSIVLAVNQSVVHRDPTTYAEWKDFPAYFTADAPPTIYGLSQSGQPLNVPPSVERVAFPAPKARAGRLSVPVQGPPGTYVLTNITGVWALLDLRGARFFGVGAGGRAIVQLTGRDGTISVDAANPPAVIVGRLISFLGLALVAANFVLIAAAALRRRRRDRLGSHSQAEQVEEAEGAVTSVG